ncbi:MAG: hypothetical protein JWM14_1760 [Chitinophagaceae bacterium]|nr:hypothetical protein [Chitinophagaceae bacterium]
MRPLLFIALFLFNAYSFAQTYTAEKFEPALMQTKTGAILVYNGEKHSFTLELVSPNLRPTENPTFIMLDQSILQAVVLPFSQKLDFDHLSIADQKQILTGYMNYELNYFKQELHQDYKKSISEWIELNGKLFLFWSYDMPKSNKELGKQIYLTTICFDQIMNLNVPMERKKNDFEDKKKLLTTIGNTLQLNDQPVNLDALYKELTK